MTGRQDGAQQEMDFHHPYQPYQIQKDLMTAIYECIEKGNVGIFESPTGTGKSLSLLCASLTWLRDHKKSQFEQDIASAATEDEPEWMQEHTRNARRQELLHRRADLEAQLQAVREKERRIRDAAGDASLPRKRAKLDHTATGADEEAAFLLDGYDSDGEQGNGTGRSHDDGLSDETKRLLKSIGLGPANESENDTEPEDELKIFICSRTHSQLSQLVGELRRIQLPSSFPASSDHQDGDYPIEGVKQLSLGSRKNLCINDKVRRLDNTSQINERCLELQEGKSGRCEYLPGKDNQAAVLDFKHYALSKTRDIEDLFTLGKKIGICPYYATRPVIRPAELVTLPYPLLLQKTAREALEISVKDHVVIIDEAHNLMDAILGIHTTEISLASLELAREQLMVYLQKFRNRLAGKNRVYVTQTLRLLNSLKQFLEGKLGQTGKASGGVVPGNELLSGQGVDQINLYKLVGYLQTSRLARKVQGYVAHTAEEKPKQSDAQMAAGRSKTAPVLNTFQTFVMALMNPAKEGRFFWSSDGTAGGSSIKYLLLDPSEHFKDIVEDARCVILVGGTMSPMDDYKSQLLPFVATDKLTMVSCGHVIPQSNLYISPLASGIGGQRLDFAFANRNSPVMLRDLGHSIVKLVESIPDGVVLFFPSYSYLSQVMTLWRKVLPGDNGSIVSLLERRKKLFIDDQSANTEQLLQQYSLAISNSGTEAAAAMLLSVIGGKLSEGINFSDQLGRCVMVIGLPYPNPNSQEWKAKMEYIEDKARDTAEKTGRIYSKGTASRDFADNVCMRAVNQAIGRAVRHKDDWAGIVLLDQRFCSNRIQDRLPRWMMASAGSGAKRGGFPEVEDQLRKFYAGKVA